MTQPFRTIIRWKRLVMILLCFCLVACLSPTAVTKSDQLSAALLQESDFSGNWTWMTSELRLTPTDALGDSQRIERVLRIMTGKYGSEKSYTNIAHVLERYSIPDPSLNTIDLKTELGSKNGEVFKPDLVPVGRSMNAQCLIAPAILFKNLGSCGVEVQYDHLVSSLSIDITGAVTKDDLVRVLNEMLQRSDEKIKQLKY